MTALARHNSSVSVFIAISMVLVAPGGAGCSGNARIEDAARVRVSDAVTGVAGIVAHTDSAQRHVERARPHTDSTGRIYLAAATDEHQAVISSAGQTKHSLDLTARAITALEGQVAATREDYTKLQSRWFVRWGQGIERGLWIIGLSWLAAGVVSVLFGLGNPLSLTWRIGKEITRLVPAMNPFSWVRDWLLARQRSGR
jgi:hypothetical protein